MRQSVRPVLWVVLLAALAAPATVAAAVPVPPVQSASSVATPDSTTTPLVVQSPGTIEIEIKIEPTADTGELRVFADSGAHYRSTTIGLSGSDSQRVHTFEWFGFPAGEYEVVGELITTSGRREVVVRAALLVIEEEVRPPPAGPVRRRP